MTSEIRDAVAMATRRLKAWGFMIAEAVGDEAPDAPSPSSRNAEWAKLHLRL